MTKPNGTPPTPQNAKQRRQRAATIAARIAAQRAERLRQIITRALARRYDILNEDPERKQENDAK